MQATTILSETIMLRPAAPGETDVVEQVWSTSQDTDELLDRPTDGWWSLTGWATTSRVLVTAGAVVGVAAVEYQPGAEAAEARVALLPAHRQRRQAVELIRTTIALALGLHAPVVRLYAPIDA